MSHERLLRLNTFERALTSARRIGSRQLEEYYQSKIDYIFNMSDNDSLPDSTY